MKANASKSRAAATNWCCRLLCPASPHYLLKLQLFHKYQKLPSYLPQVVRYKICAKKSKFERILIDTIIKTLVEGTA